MELKEIASAKYKILAVTNRGVCPIEELLLGNEASTQAWRDRLLEMLSDISQLGLHGAPHIWSKALRHGIHELKAGKLRIFYFKGHNDIVLICTCLLRKSSKKADDDEIDNAIRLKVRYDEAVRNNRLVIFGDEE